jgi:SAM-dependent methyltransferase
MVDWGKGYITDIEYSDKFYPTMAPQHLALTAAFNGFEPPDIDANLTYCELGCSRGLTSLILAAVNPNAVFHAVDFNPASIARAHARARAAGLDNITFHERSFEELTEPYAGLPKFDIVAMHGVWSWVGPELRRAIVAFLKSHLKPGGLVWVSYNVLPAWNEMMPLQRVLRELAAAQPVRSDQAIGNAIAMVNRLAEKGIIAPRFREGIQRLNNAAARDPDLTYLAHEYLHTGWAPDYFADVARALAEAKLSYVGSTQLTASFSNIGFNEEQRALLAGIAAPEVRETLRDFCSNNQFRQDVFVRGARPMTEVRRQSLLNKLPLALVAPVPEVVEITTSTGEKLRADPATYRRILEALHKKPHSAEELRSLANPLFGPMELVATLLDSGLVRLWRAPGHDAEDAAARFNALQENDISFLHGATIAVPSVGLGLRLSPTEFALYAALRRGEAPHAAALAECLVGHWREAGRQTIVNGKVVADERLALAAVAKECENKILRCVPVWRMLGIVS